MRLVFTGVASGLNCTMPKGMVAPGKTLPPLVVPTRGLTRDAGSDWPTKADAEAAVMAIRGAAMRMRRTAELRATCMHVKIRHVGRAVLLGDRCRGRRAVGDAGISMR